MYHTKVTYESSIKMFYNKEITEKLKTDTILRLKVCLALGVTEQSVQMGLKHRRKTLLNINAVNAIKDHTGLAEDQIFELEEGTEKP